VDDARIDFQMRDGFFSNVKTTV